MRIAALPSMAARFAYGFAELSEDELYVFLVAMFYNKSFISEWYYDKSKQLLNSVLAKPSSRR